MFRKYGRGQVGVEQLKRAYLLVLYENDRKRKGCGAEAATLLATTLLAKKEAKEAANRKRAATLLAKKEAKEAALAKGEATPRNKKQRV
jgi:hypothetical protein